MGGREPSRRGGGLFSEKLGVAASPSDFRTCRTCQVKQFLHFLIFQAQLMDKFLYCPIHKSQEQFQGEILKLRRIFEHKTYEYERRKTSFILYSKFKFMTSTPQHQAKLQSPITGHLGILASNISIRTTSCSGKKRIESNSGVGQEFSCIHCRGVCLCAHLICDLWPYGSISV